MGQKWFGISRDQIDWFPTIDYDKCTSCLACVKKCTHGVFTQKEGKPLVIEQKNCIVGCTGCEPVCPNSAISHPPKSYLQELAKREDFESGCNCGGGCK